jgi:hypothetical protein
MKLLGGAELKLTKKKGASKARINKIQLFVFFYRS